MYDKSGFILAFLILIHRTVCKMKRTVDVCLQRVYFHNAQAGSRIIQTDLTQVIVTAN